MMVKPAGAQDDRFGTRGAYSNGTIDGDVRKSMNAAFEAMSEWRDELASTAERNAAKVFEKMGAAAKAAGWPDSMVEATKSNMQQISKLQLTMLDQVMDAWTEQMKNPGKLTFGNAIARGTPGFNMGQGVNPMFPGMPQLDLSKFGFGTNPMAPFQFWMEASQQWQKQWADIMTSMMNGLPGGQPDATSARGKSFR